MYFNKGLPLLKYFQLMTYDIIDRPPDIKLPEHHQVKPPPTLRQDIDISIIVHINVPWLK